VSRMLLLLFLLSTPLAWAQENDPVGDRSAGDQSRSRAPTTGDDQSRSQTAPTGSDESRSQTAPTEGDPFDYESSEQISEDLSVSFPVDI
jgi:hypothetical protein